MKTLSPFEMISKIKSAIICKSDTELPLITFYEAFPGCVFAGVSIFLAVVKPTAIAAAAFGFLQLPGIKPCTVGSAPTGIFLNLHFIAKS